MNSYTLADSLLDPIATQPTLADVDSLATQGVRTQRACLLARRTFQSSRDAQLTAMLAATFSIGTTSLRETLSIRECRISETFGSRYHDAQAMLHAEAVTRNSRRILLLDKHFDKTATKEEEAELLQLEAAENVILSAELQPSLEALKSLLRQ